jgi:hypothetical protein
VDEVRWERGEGLQIMDRPEILKALSSLEF